MRQLNFIDLFAGAGGLSEGFIRAGFHALAHVEMDANACDTLRTRIAFHELCKTNEGKVTYEKYLRGEVSRETLYARINPDLFESVINEEISEETINDIFVRVDALKGRRQVDVVVGGPPCQAYSLVGRARDPEGMKNDKRNYLFKYYAEFLGRYRPKFFVFENVLGLLSAGNSSYFTEMKELFRECGYVVNFDVLHSENYGVLQKRRRVVIVGKRTKRKFEFTWPEKVENHFEVLRDLFTDLPPLAPGDTPKFVDYIGPNTRYLEESKIRNGFAGVSQHITRNHNPQDLEIYQIAIKEMLSNNNRLKYTDLPERLQSHKNLESFLDRFKVVDPKGKSHTMVAHISKDGHHYIYPSLKQIRSLSVREAARIQSFPDDYFFEGGKTAAFRQIGNAVPPLMGEKIAKVIALEFMNSTTKNK
jgi:DNA (cytosine-5)-methyltransferase 1